MQKELENEPRRRVRAAGSTRPRVNLRAKEDERRKLQVELYQNNLFCFEQDTD